MTTTERVFTTPMMQQYGAIKREYEDCLLFFRLGDFYELFLDDAKVGANVLDITLTRRPRGKDGDIPMAGVPYHAADAYIAKLVKAGYKVAICEQMSEPNAKGIVEREVVRVVTPGTIMDDRALEHKEHNYVMSLSIGKKAVGIAVADVGTGDFQVASLLRTIPLEQMLGVELARFSPTECILESDDYHNADILRILNRHDGLNISSFESFGDYADDADRILCAHLGVSTLASFGLADVPETLCAAGGLFGYLSYTQQERLSHIRTIRRYDPHEYVVLDESTIRNLELFSTVRGHNERGSLLAMLDETKTAMGGRLLREWVRRPLRSLEAIEERSEAVSLFVGDHGLRTTVRERLSRLCDIERILSRLAVGLGTPHDLLTLKDSLDHARDLGGVIGAIEVSLVGRVARAIADEDGSVARIIAERIAEEAPLQISTGGVIAAGVSGELDALRGQEGSVKEWVRRCEKEEREKTGISSLKVKYNKVFGYYIEVRTANLHLVPEHYIRRQTMANAERFITPALKEQEERILSAQSKIEALEMALFAETIEMVLAHIATLQTLATELAVLDGIATFAVLAERYHYTRPTLTPTGGVRIEEGRHPVVERFALDPFVPNDVLLNQKNHQLLLITGPNMAGKSVFMRQCALIVLMAHMGSFVPATSATMSIVDRVFVRSGAADMITSGLSTFMVEMVETAHILHHATPQSLVILDEIGRGTSTYDGMSIAWAIAEYLVTHAPVGAKTLFATHYHELQTLAEHYPKRVKNYQVLAQEDDGAPIFLHTVVPGGASHSYGIAVGRLAGLPAEVLERASDLLERMEAEAKGVVIEKKRSRSVRRHSSVVERAIKTLEIETMTPVEALVVLEKLQKKCSDDYED